MIAVVIKKHPQRKELQHKEAEKHKIAPDEEEDVSHRGDMGPIALQMDSVRSF